jgi:hypothetical protein
MIDLNEQLRECAHCGHQGSHEVDAAAVAPYGHTVVCNACCASVGSYPSEAAAIAAWNRRAPAPQAAPSDLRMVPLETLRLIETAMNRMGDQLNNMDAVEEEDEEATAEAFRAIHALTSAAAPAVAITQAATSEPVGEVKIEKGLRYIEWKCDYTVFPVGFKLYAAPVAAPAGDALHKIADYVADNWPMRKYTLAEIESKLRGAVAHLAGTTPNTEAPMDEAAASAAMAEGNKHGVKSTDTLRILAAYSIALSAQQAGVQEAPSEDAKDAQRYRYLRNTETLDAAVWDALEGHGSMDADGNLNAAGYRAGFDQAIDAALAAATQTEKKL